MPKMKTQGKRNHTGHRIGAWHQRARHSDETVQQARQLYAHGIGYRAIGKQLGVPWRTVCDWVNYTTRYDSKEATP